jgi:hypothetical protein
MRKLSTVNIFSKLEAKSLFHKILAVSPCSSRFCRHPPYPRVRKSFEIMILSERRKKMLRDINPTEGTYEVQCYGVQ